MNDSKYDDSDSDDDYKEVVVNSSDFRKEVYEFSSHRDLKVIKCIGQIESEFNYQVENEYKVSAVGTGTVYRVVNGVAFTVTCAHNIRLKVYNCSKCNTYNKTKTCSKCTDTLTSNDKKYITPTHIEFTRRDLTPNNFGLSKQSYKCEEVYIPDAYENNTILKRGFDFAVLMFIDDGYYNQNCKNIILDVGTKILATH
eukprot:147137_1